MAKVTIVLEDDGSGGADLSLDFEPAVDVSEITYAQWLASMVFKAISDVTGGPAVGNYEQPN